MNTKKSGFSIIEVALVLGIAGLIFVMAFIALPSLQASQRDADRKARVMEFINAVKTYQTNNSRGALPKFSNEVTFSTKDAKDTPATDVTSWQAFVRDYVLPSDSGFEDPTGNPYSFYINECGASTVNEACLAGQFTDPNKNGVDLNTKANQIIYVAIGATCDGDQMVKTNSNRGVAAIQILERAGRYCYNT